MEIDWDQIAPAYELQVPLERFAVRRLIELLGVRPDDEVLDVATGTGAVLRELARLPEPPGRVVGIDASAVMLSQAWGIPPNWDLRRGDARDLPFADGSFDVVTAGYLLHVLATADRGTVLSEAARVLAPGGRLGVITVAETGPLSRAALRPLADLAVSRGGALRGLLPLDPRADLIEAGYRPVTAARAWLGYPSLCVVARRESEREPNDRGRAPPLGRTRPRCETFDSG